MGFLFGMSACSQLPQKYQFIRNNRDDYRTALSTQPLTIPPGDSSAQFKDYYPVPNPQLADGTPVDLTPPGLDPSKVKPEHHWY